MSISAEQWDDIENALAYRIFPSIHLKCDDYAVTLQVSMDKSRLRREIFVFVNGEFCGQWLITDCEERRRFIRPASRYALPAKLRAGAIKVFGGKRCPKSELERINRRIVSYWPTWTSVSALRRHLVKHNKTVELVNIE